MTENKAVPKATACSHIKTNLYFSFVDYPIPRRMRDYGDYAYADDVAAIRACLAAATHPETNKYFKQRYNQLKKEIRQSANSYAEQHANRFYHLLLYLSFPPERAFERKTALYKSMRDEFIRASYP
jgi:hypothetical protein